MTTTAWVMIGGAIGAPARYLLDRWISSRHTHDWPWGTFVINVLGSFLLAALIGSALTVESTVAFLGAGILGAFTTWSTFAVEVVRLGQEGERRNALSYLLASLIAGFLAAWVAYRLFS